MVVIPQGIVRVGRRRDYFFEGPMNKKLVFILPLFLLGGSLVEAYELMMPVRQVEKIVVGVAWYQAQRDLNLQLTSNDWVSVGSLSYLSAVTSDYSVATTNNGVQAKVLFQPHDELVYWLAFGSTAYDIEIPSVSVKNRFASQSPGWMVGAGIRKILLPDTIVTPALAVDAGINHSETNLTVFYPGGMSPMIAQNIFLTTEYHVALAVSKKYKYCEPYSSVRVARTMATLRDKGFAAEVSGKKEAVSVLTGLRLRPYPNESLICEASFFGEAGFSIGWNIEF
jgi:hypothetical protein